MDTPLSTIPHCSPPNMKDYWPVHHYTVSEAPDLHPSLIWYSLFSSSSSPTDKQKWWGTYCWLAPCVIEMSPPFFPVRQLFISHSFQLCGARLGIIEAAVQLHGQRSTDAQLSCPGTTKDQLQAPWQLRLFWESSHEDWSWISAAQELKLEESRRTCVQGHSFVSVIVSGPKNI